MRSLWLALLVIGLASGLVVQTARSSASRPCIAAARGPLRVAGPPVMGKKGGKPKGAKTGKKQQGREEKKSVKDNRVAEQTKSFIYTILGLGKTLPDGSRTLIKNINLCFFPGAKIGLVGLNGAGKSTLMKIMAGVDTECNAGLGLEHHRRADTTAVWV